MPAIHSFDCGHGREMRLVFGESVPSVAFVVLDDVCRTHDLLCWRDNPSVTVAVEGPAVLVLRGFAAGQYPAQTVYDALVRAEPFRSSEWRRSLLQDFVFAAKRYDYNARIREAMGVE